MGYGPSPSSVKMEYDIFCLVLKQEFRSVNILLSEYFKPTAMNFSHNIFH